MLRTEIALDLVHRLSTHLDYNINIMDDHGVIIASRDQTRIGDYHEAAHRIIEANEAIEIIYPGEHLSPGVKPGVNLPIAYRGRTIGVVGITGNPSDVMNLAYAVKSSVESTIEYEMYKERIERRQNAKNHFQNVLLYEEAASEASIATLAEKLGYSEQVARVPILLRFPVPTDSREILAVTKQVACHSKQDISFVTISMDILIFKAIERRGHSLTGSVKWAVRDLAEQVESALALRELPTTFRVYVGSLQTRFKLYRTAHNHVEWLMSHPGLGTDRILYFWDYLYHYIRSSVPDSLFESIFSAFGELLHPSVLSSLQETAEALLRNNMSISDAAADLSVHRNTLRSRIDRLRADVGIDPFKSTTDRELLLCLNEYLKLSRRP